MKVLVLVLSVVAHSRRSCTACIRGKRKETHQEENSYRRKNRKPSNNLAHALKHHVSNPWMEAIEKFSEDSLNEYDAIDTKGCVVMANPTLQDLSEHFETLLDRTQHLLPSCAKPAPGLSSSTTLFPPAWISSMARVWEIPRAGSPLISTISSPTCSTYIEETKQRKDNKKAITETNPYV